MIFLTFFQVMKDRSLGFDPLRVVYAHTHRDCEYIIVTGSNKACAVFTQEGIKVTSVAEQESWVWACVMKPNSSSMVSERKLNFSKLAQSLLSISVYDGRNKFVVTLCVEKYGAHVF